MTSRTSVAERGDQRAKRSYHHGDLANAVAAVALELMTERNGPDFSLREIAARLGVQHPSVYRHFQDKAALLQRITADGFDRLYRYQLDHLRGVEGPRERLLANGQNHVRFCLDNPGLFKLMFDYGVSTTPQSNQIIDARDKSASLLSELIQACKAAGLLGALPSDLIRVGLWSTAHGLVHLIVTENFAQMMPQAIPLDEVIQTTLEAAIAGFSAS